jgi:hypothetical protein
MQVAGLHREGPGKQQGSSSLLLSETQLWHKICQILRSLRLLKQALGSTHCKLLVCIDHGWKGEQQSNSRHSCGVRSNCCLPQW